ncbi:MAG: hypothetical protein KF899_00405 [Parvibaculum sp.]|nr:hypothetical protein [Parvibaculum sp.]
MKYVYHLDKVLTEIYRTLSDGGFEWVENGDRADFKSPEFHGSPAGDQGSIVAFDHGYDLSRNFTERAPLNIRVYRFSGRTHRILGEYTDAMPAGSRGARCDPCRGYLAAACPGTTRG